jgi:hypothetical protein
MSKNRAKKLLSAVIVRYRPLLSDTRRILAADSKERIARAEAPPTRRPFRRPWTQTPINCQSQFIIF